MLLEVLNYLKNVNTIEGIDLETLSQLFSSPTKIHKNFIIKVVAKDSIVVYNKNINKNTMIKCVKNYYDLGDSGCMSIKRDKLKLSIDCNCKECHLKCLTKQATGTLNKL